MDIPATTRQLLRHATEQQGLCGAALGIVNVAGKRATLTLGDAQRLPERVLLHEGMYWDLASLTKPLFTARNILRATEQGLLDLDDALSDHLPELAWMQPAQGDAGTLKERTLRQLLTHTAGLPEWLPVYTWGDATTIRARLMQEPYALRPAGQVVYSDLGYMLLGRVLERVYQRPLSAFELDDGLTFAPDPAQTVATEACAWRGRVLRGETHDENAGAQASGEVMGVAGHAGLFGTLAGVLNQAELLLRGQEKGGWLGAAAQAAATRPAAQGRTLAFVLAQPHFSGGSLCSPSAYGHTGFTGTGLWVDPERGLAWVLLTNRVHPSRHNSIDIQDLRRKVGNTIQAGALA